MNLILTCVEMDTLEGFQEFGIPEDFLKPTRWDGTFNLDKTFTDISHEEVFKILGDNTWILDTVSGDIRARLYNGYWE